MNGMTAEELAALAGSGLTRSVISNIESGRKTNLTVAHLLALSEALGVPPTALVVSLEEPERVVATGTSTGELTSNDVVEWLAGAPLEKGELTPAGQKVRVALFGIREYYRALRDLKHAVQEGAHLVAALDEPNLKRMSQDVVEKADYLRDIGIKVGPANQRQPLDTGEYAWLVETAREAAAEVAHRFAEEEPSSSKDDARKL